MSKSLIAKLMKLDDTPCSVSYLFRRIHKGILNNNIAEVSVHVPHLTKDGIILQSVKETGQKRESKRIKNLQIKALKSSEARVLITVHLQDSTEMPNIID
jgi:hypothetical protein